MRQEKCLCPKKKSDREECCRLNFAKRGEKIFSDVLDYYLGSFDLTVFDQGGSSLSSLRGVPLVDGGGGAVIAPPRSSLFAQRLAIMLLVG